MKLAKDVSLSSTKAIKSSGSYIEQSMSESFSKHFSGKPQTPQERHLVEKVSCTACGNTF